MVWEVKDPLGWFVGSGFLLLISHDITEILLLWRKTTTNIQSSCSRCLAHWQCLAYFQHKVEEDLEREKRRVSELKMSLKTMTEELTKGNEIIKKLQNDIKNYHSKVRS